MAPLGGSRSWEAGGWLAFSASVVGAATAALVVFAPWRPPYFVLDVWYHFERFGPVDVSSVLARLVPTQGDWYRPLTELSYWLTWQPFGLDPTGHFALHVAAHALTSVLIAYLVWTVSSSRLAVLVAGLAFLFALQAHEVVWDHSDRHIVLVAPAIVGAVLLHVRGRRALSIGLGVIALATAEAGMLVAPLIALYELLLPKGASKDYRDRLTSAAARVAPHAAVLAAYITIRVLVGGGFANEVAETCWTVPCLGVAALEYFNRLVVRGEPLVAVLWSDRYVVAAVVSAVVAGLLALGRAWRWSDLRPFAFGVGWAAGASLFFVLALWPYIADRFVYIPAIGVCIALGAGVAQMTRMWPGSSTAARGAAMVVVGAVAIWIALGALTNLERGKRWVDAGRLAHSLAVQVNELVPDPPRGGIVVMYGMPRSLAPGFPPGNTGPYVYHNGMASAMDLLYGWEDVSFPPVPALPFDVLPQIERPIVFLRLEGETVVRLPGPMVP